MAKVIFNFSSYQMALWTTYCRESKNLYSRPDQLGTSLSLQETAENNDLFYCCASAGQISYFQNIEIKYLLIT